MGTVSSIDRDGKKGKFEHDIFVLPNFSFVCELASCIASFVDKIGCAIYIIQMDP